MVKKKPVFKKIGIYSSLEAGKVKHIADHLNYTNNKVNIISEENYQDSIILDTSLLRRSYDWTPKVIIKEGIQKWLN